MKYLILFIFPVIILGCDEASLNKKIHSVAYDLTYTNTNDKGLSEKFEGDLKVTKVGERSTSDSYFLFTFLEIRLEIKGMASYWCETNPLKYMSPFMSEKSLPLEGSIRGDLIFRRSIKDRVVGGFEIHQIGSKEGLKIVLTNCSREENASN